MPEPIKLKLGGVTNQQSAVYNEFARNVPGFKPLTDRELHSILPKATPQIGSGDTGGSGSGPGGPGQQQQPSSTNSNEQLVTSVECIAILEEVLSKVEPFVSNCTALPDNPHMANLRTLVEDLALARTSKEASHIVVLINKAVEALLEGLTPHLGHPVETDSLPDIATPIYWYSEHWPMNGRTDKS